MFIHPEELKNSKARQAHCCPLQLRTDGIFRDPVANDYPRDWPKIRARIRERAGNRCERCGVAPGEVYTRHSGKVVSKKEFERLGKAATKARKQRIKEHEQALRIARARFLSTSISEAEMSGDYDNWYSAEGGYYPIESAPINSRLIADSNNNRASHFEVHHLDGDKSNNKDSNLQFLCKRCHMVQT